LTGLHSINQGILRVLDQIPSLDRAKRIEQRAVRIVDPVKRLHYLRQEMALTRVMPAPVVPAPQVRRRPVRSHGLRRLVWAALAVAIVLAPGRIPQGTAEVFTQERRLLVPGTDSSIPVETTAPKVWRVDHSETLEQYSNGLRVDLTFAVSNRPRADFPIYALTGASAEVKTGNAPVGIVFHTTESLLANFEEDQNRRLKYLGRNLLEVVRQERSYHYLIDRFGRVFRVVEESDAANHAGRSIWADDQGIYVNLNDSFLGVSFEAQTGEMGAVTPAQISSAKMLTEMLRSRYGIPAENCVTHAQVSVNSSNMRIGTHTDWAAQFPFASLGLPDNYSIPLPSLYAFGFNYDDAFLQATGARWKGLDLAEEQVQKQAAIEALPVARYRAILQHRYKDIEAELKEKVKEREENEGGT
jgi:hypothetical protein